MCIFKKDMFLPSDRYTQGFSNCCSKPAIRKCHYCGTSARIPRSEVGKTMPLTLKSFQRILLYIRTIMIVLRTDIISITIIVTIIAVLSRQDFVNRHG